jgi:arylformamidase
MAEAIKQVVPATEKWIDVSVGLHSGMVHWPDNPPIELEFVMQLDKGDGCNVSKLSMGTHSATHMDAPLHFFEDGASIDTMPLSTTIGRARVIEIHDPESIKPTELEQYDIRVGERILFKTSNSLRAWQPDRFVEDFVYISKEAAQYVAGRKIQLVGVDYLSVGGYHADGAAIHRALLGANIWIIEGLNLAQVQPGEYELICLPIKLLGHEGAPARALLKPVLG